MPLLEIRQAMASNLLKYWEVCGEVPESHMARKYFEHLRACSLRAQ